MNQMLSGIDRATIIKATAVYLLIYGLANSCLGILAGIGGLFVGLAGGVTAASLAGAGVSTLSDGSSTAAASGALAAGGALLVILGILYLISVPVFLLAAWGLFKRKSWARIGAVVALGFSILLSVLSLSHSFGSIIWILISGFAIYLFYTDAGIKMELSK